MLILGGKPDQGGIGYISNVYKLLVSDLLMIVALGGEHCLRELVEIYVLLISLCTKFAGCAPS